MRKIGWKRQTKETKAKPSITSQRLVSHNSSSMFYRTKLPEEKRKQEVVLGKLYDNYESEFPKLTTKPARISEESLHKACINY